MDSYHRLAQDLVGHTLLITFLGSEIMSRRVGDHCCRGCVMISNWKKRFANNCAHSKDIKNEHTVLSYTPLQAIICSNQSLVYFDINTFF